MKMDSNDNKMVGDALAFAKDMKVLINNKDTSDVKFIVGSNRKAVYAHRCILAARCQVFRVMMEDQTQKTDVPVVLSDMSPRVFTAMMEFIYTNCCSLDAKTVVDVLATSLEYGLDGLKQLCVKYLVQNISRETACEAMQAAVTFGLSDVRQSAITCIEQQTKEVFQTKGFKEMSGSALAAVLKSDKLMIDELDVISAVKDWARSNATLQNKSMGSVAKEVVQHIRLPLLSPRELQDVEKENGKETDKMIPVEQLSSAWKCHALKQGETDNPAARRRAGTAKRDP